VPPNETISPWLFPDTPQCWHHHMGIWAVVAERLLPAFHAWQMGQSLQEPAPSLQIDAAERRPYDLTNAGVAIIDLMGPITKSGSLKFQGTSSVRTQRALRVASMDPDVSGIMLRVDSPGGHVAGIDALASEVRRIRARGEKRIATHGEDLIASAAYWIGSQSDFVSASPMTEVGSLGTVAVVEDTSNRMDRLGIKVHVISTGPYKGIGAEGAPVSEGALAYLRERVEAMNEHFIAAVQHGRRMGSDQTRALFDGQVHLAEKARALGLIDTVQSFEEAVARLSSSPSVLPARQGRMSQAAARLARAEAFHARGGAHASHE
jgi:signal peptide peptidase SppA